MRDSKLVRLSMFLSTCVMCVGVSSSPLASQATTFSEDFEDDLSRWVGKSGGSHHALIVSDPLRAGNDVVTFFGLNAAGDIFSSEVRVSEGVQCSLSFEYLGDPSQGGSPGNLGGFIGFAEDTPARHRWLQGTALIGGAEDDALADDGHWSSYMVDFDPFAIFVPSGGTIRIMVEDFVGSGGIAGDAYFDNIELRCALDVRLDIKPGSQPNCLNIDGHGVIPVAVLGSSKLDVYQIDVNSLLFAGLGVRVRGRKGPLCAYEHVNRDSYLDLLCHFEDDASAWAPGVGEACLLGALLAEFESTPIEGCDSICIVP